MKHLKTIFLGLSFLTLAASCSKDDSCTSGSGSNTSRTYNMSTFDKLSFYGDAEIFITKDSDQSLVIEGQQNILNELNVSVSNNVLSVGKDNCFQSHNQLKLYISVPSLKGISTSGSSTIQSPDTFVETDFITDISGMSSMELNLDVQDFNLTSSGDGNVTINGMATNQMYTVSGEFNAKCFGFEGENVDIDGSGITNMEVNATTTLNVKLSGSGTIYYKGFPTIDSDISGSGSIVDAN